MHCLRLCHSKHGGSPCHCDFVAWKHPVRINQLAILQSMTVFIAPRQLFFKQSNLARADLASRGDRHSNGPQMQMIQECLPEEGQPVYLAHASGSINQACTSCLQSSHASNSRCATSARTRT